MAECFVLLLLGTVWVLGSQGQNYNKDDFNTLEDIFIELTRLANVECAVYGLQLRCVEGDIGMSEENRAIRTFTVSTRIGSPMPIIAIDALMNPRERLSGSTTMLILDRLIKDYNNSSTVRNLLDTFTFVFMPVMNPDGYQYTWDTNRSWNKNRGVNPGSNCIGTDLNRNFNYDWGGSGSSDDPCADTYRGPTEASATETQKFQHWYNSVNPLAYLSVKSYGRYFVHPYGDTSDPPSVSNVSQIADAACAAIEGTYGTSWDCGNSGTELYPTSGTSTDWVTAFANMKYSYSVITRGYSFDAPTSDIQPAFEEVWNGLVAMAEEIKAIEGL